MATYTGRQYKLRAGTPMPTATTGHFVFHTFMAATKKVEINTCVTSVPTSDMFRGQGGSLQSASYSRLPVTANGEELFRGQETTADLFDSEDAWGFNND